MDIEFKGANCIAITHKKDVFVTDAKLSDNGLKDQGLNAVAQLATQRRFVAPHAAEVLAIDGPGEYEVRNCSIKGVAARSHMDAEATDKSATMYRLNVDDVSVAIVGHIFPKLSAAQLEELGVIDILIVPVGNHGYTLDAKGAVEVVRAIDPKIVIPTHYADDGVTYEVPQASLDEFTKELGAKVEETPKLKLKSGQFPDALTVYHITRTK